MQGGDDAPVLARVELAEAIEGDDEIPLGDLHTRFETSGVLDLIDVDLHVPRGGPQGRRGIVHMVPARGVLQATHHVQSRGREHEVAVVQIMLFRCEHGHHRTGLLSWVRCLLGGKRRGCCQPKNQNDSTHTLNDSAQL
jgi:hypothetical protein